MRDYMQAQLTRKTFEKGIWKPTVDTSYDTYLFSQKYFFELLYNGETISPLDTSYGVFDT